METPDQTQPYRNGSENEPQEAFYKMSLETIKSISPMSIVGKTKSLFGAGVSKLNNVVDYAKASWMTRLYEQDAEIFAFATEIRGMQAKYREMGLQLEEIRKAQALLVSPLKAMGMLAYDVGIKYCVDFESSQTLYHQTTDIARQADLFAESLASSIDCLETFATRIVPDLLSLQYEYEMARNATYTDYVITLHAEWRAAHEESIPPPNIDLEALEAQYAANERLVLMKRQFKSKYMILKEYQKNTVAAHISKISKNLSSLFVVASPPLSHNSPLNRKSDAEIHNQTSNGAAMALNNILTAAAEAETGDNSTPGLSL